MAIDRESMVTQLQFKPSFGASAIYLAQHALHPSPTTNADLIEPLQPAAADLSSCLNWLGLDSAHAWHGLLNASVQWDSNRELATAFLRKFAGASKCQPQAVDRLAGTITSLEAAVRSARPNLEAELALRVGPLREHWDARGPGMMFRLAKTTDPDLPPPQALVAIVEPVCGGGGAALLASNSVVLEGVLVNSDPALPEVLRLAWLVAQLQLDLPKFSEAIPPARLLQIAPLALLPPILEAASFVELIPSASSQLASAISAWMPVETPPTDLADVLWTWWEAQTDSQVPWRVALGGLDRLVP
jgi:hypothetical protein